MVSILIRSILPALAITILNADYEAASHVPSFERGDANYRRATNEDVNKVRTTIFNYGITGRSGANAGEIPYEWPVNSGKHYIAMTALSAGAEVSTESGIDRPMVTIPFRSDQSGNSKSWEPVPGYLNSASTKIAISDDESTWPMIWPDKMEDDTDAGWSGSWNGMFGKDIFNAEQEIYYKVSDDLNFEDGYIYYPDSTDLSRQGSGLLTGVRILEWKQILIEDVVFIIHEIKNDGTEDLQRVAFSLWLADLVGGDGDSGDDTPDFDLIYDVAWSMDADGIGNTAFGADPVGVAATSFIETPGNNVDRIDNDGDAEDDGPIIEEEMLEGEELGDSVDNNGNGLIDENLTHVPFGTQQGVSYADRIDNDGDGEIDSPTVTQAMIDAASSEQWQIWPSVSGNDELQNGIIHLIGVDAEDLNMAYADGIDNNVDVDDPYILEYPNGTGADVDGPLITQGIIDIAAADEWQRYRVPGTEIILYNVGVEDLGRPYADGVDNDGDGAVDEGIDEGIDEMIDESRDDFIDNDGDWTIDDDNGLYGDDSGGFEVGVGNQAPTSGSGTGFPGEPNIDKTDVSESDQMGLTAVGYDPAGSIPTGSSAQLWQFYLTPGSFWQPPAGGQPPGDYDLFVTSSFFPLKAGQTERIAMAVALGNDVTDAKRNKANAQTAYDFDYRFAKAPTTPNVSAVAEDGQVILYWDRSAEDSYDDFMEKIGDDPRDFEGYKIYRATDLEFNDAYKITDGEGNPTFYKPYSLDGVSCQWDLNNGVSGWHELDMNGIKFYLGDDTGLQHFFIDTDVINGQTYYYAVVAYDFGGDATNNIIPSDSPMRLRINTLTGDLEMGPNVVKAIPVQPAAGYVEPITSVDIPLIFGQSNGQVQYDVIDPLQIHSDNKYEITFSDSMNYTNKYYLTNITDLDNPEIVIDALGIDDTYHPVIDGFKLSFTNITLDEIKMVDSLSFWNSSELWEFEFDNRDAFTVGDAVPANYRIVYMNEQEETECYCSDWINPTLDPCSENAPSAWCSTILYESKSLNVKVEKQVYSEIEDDFKWQEIPFAFGDYSPYNPDTQSSNPDGKFNADERETDYLIFLDIEDENGQPKQSWSFTLDYPGSNSVYADCCNEPQIGDTAFVVVAKPFLSTDVYEFSPQSPFVDNEVAKNEMEAIYVVPNPYFSTVPWEEHNTYSTGRGPREIQFRNLPSECTIRIYTVSGERVKTIEHFTSIDNGMEPWDLLTKDNLSASFGVYIYHVDAPGIGEFVGKFAVVK